MRKVIIVLMAVIFVAFASSVASAQGEVDEVGSAAEIGEIINDTCPVMGGKVDKDSPYKTVYEGKTIGFCCPNCVEKFNADPEKYIAKLEEKCIIKCPKCGTEIDVTEKCRESMMCMMGGMQPAEQSESGGNDR